MFKFSLKYMSIRLGKNILIALSIVITLVVALLAYNISNQVKDGIISSYQYYDTIIGPAGSSTQLVLNTLFYSDKPLGLVDYDEYEALLDDRRVADAIPFGQGDSYGGARIIGTANKFLNGYELQDGVNFTSPYEAVVGYSVAKSQGLTIGSEFFSTHGVTGDVSGHEHAEEGQEYKVVGILERTHTAADNVIFVDIHTVWETHGISGETHEHNEDENHEHTEEYHADEDSNHVQAEHGEDEEHFHGGLTAILLRCNSAGDAMMLQNDYQGLAGVQAANPSEVMRELLANVDTTRNIVYILCGIILLMNLFIVCVITMLNMFDVKKDIELLRLIGVSQGRIEAVVYIQNLIISLVSCAVAFALSRILMTALASVSANMGVVFNLARVYALEFAIIAVVVVATFLPTMILVKKLFKGGILTEN